VPRLAQEPAARLPYLALARDQPGGRTHGRVEARSQFFEAEIAVDGTYLIESRHWITPSHSHYEFSIFRFSRLARSTTRACIFRVSYIARCHGFRGDETLPKSVRTETGEEQLQAAIELRHDSRNLDVDVIGLKFLADKGDCAAALQLAERELNRERPNGIQAYRWLYVAGETARAAETLAAFSPEERRQAERVTAAYLQRPTARK
jgi:hypothetical protein